MFDIKKMQNVQLSILDELKRVCLENGLSYALAFGTCLGAIRHKGFIPWDDDIDVYMPITDFNKLIKLQNKFQKRYFLQTNETDPEYGLMIGRLRDSETTLIEKGESCRNINHGVFIDIYPVFNCPGSKIKQKFLVASSLLLRLMLYGATPKNRGFVMKVGAGVVLKLCPKVFQKKVVDVLKRLLLNQPESNYKSSFYGDEVNIRYKTETLFPFTYVDFQGRREPVPNNYDVYLKQTYGDYMKLPPVEKQVIHHDFEFVDFEKSYKNYYGVYYCKE